MIENLTVGCLRGNHDRKIRAFRLCTLQYRDQVSISHKNTLELAAKSEKQLKKLIKLRYLQKSNQQS